MCDTERRIHQHIFALARWLFMAARFYGCSMWHLQPQSGGDSFLLYASYRKFGQRRVITQKTVTLNNSGSGRTGLSCHELPRHEHMSRAQNYVLQLLARRGWRG
jgi:hypothetical protein